MPDGTQRSPSQYLSGGVSSSSNGAAAGPTPVGMPGPGPVPSPWRQNGPQVFYDEGGQTMPSTVAGGQKGAGSINAQALYVNGVPVTVAGNTVSLQPGTGIVMTPQPIVGTGIIGIDTTVVMLLSGGTMTGTLNWNKGAPLTASTPAINIQQTWNNAAVDFNGFAMNIVDTAQGPNSKAFRIQRNGSDTCTIDRYGTIVIASGLYGGDRVQMWGSGYFQNNNAPPAGGDLAQGLFFSNLASFGVLFGSGVPNKAAAQGSLYLRSDGGGAPYYNTNGTTGGWTQIGSGGGGASISVGTTPPASPTSGALWWNSETGQLFLFYIDVSGPPGQWVPASPSAGSGSAGTVYIGTTPPSSPAPGTLYWQSELAAMFIWYDDGTGSPQWVPATPSSSSSGVLRLYSEQVCVGGETQMNVTIPANAKYIDLEFVYQAASGDPTGQLNCVESGVVNVSATHSTQTMYGQGSTTGGGLTTSQTYWTLGGAQAMSGSIKLMPRPNNIGAWIGNTVTYPLSTTTRFTQVASWDGGANPITTTGFRITLSASTFLVGSFLRAYVVT